MTAGFGLLWCCLAMASHADPLAPALASTNAPAESDGPERLKKQVRIVVETNIVVEAAGPDGASGKSFDWQAQWKAWDGLHFSLSKKTPLEDPLRDVRGAFQGTNSQPVFHLEEMKMSGKIGAKFAVDGAAFATSDSLDFDAGAELRRARVYARGDCLLVLPVSYELEVGYVPGSFYIESSYLSFKNIPAIGELKGGQFQPPMSLEMITSSRDIAFMETAAPVQALAPGTSAGVQIGKPVFDRRATWKLGLFTDGVGTDFGDATKDYGRAIFRFTGLPLYQPRAEHPEEARLLHLGLSANVVYSGGGAIQYRTRPESHLAPYVLDTGEIEADGALVLGAEGAWIHGPLTIQAEYLHSLVRQPGDSLLSFDGLYASAGWMLTGETRRYDRSEGCLARVIPRRNFNWGKGGWGAVEVAGRFSLVNLNSEPVEGGRMAVFMAGVNWFLHSHVKWRFDYGLGRASDGPSEGRFNIFQTRLELDF
jgi:phosphate-selective porin OprO/OprP